MALLDFLFGGKQSLSSATDSGLWASLFGTSESKSGVCVTAESALRVTAVFSCIRVLAEGMAQLPLHTYERLASGGKQLALQHPLTQLMRKPNKWQTRFEWIEMMQGHVALRGNAYSEILPGPLGAASELIPLNPDRMKVERLDNGELGYFYRELGGRETQYSQYQIFHLRGLSSDGVSGLNPIAAAREAIGVAIAAEGHEAATMRNGGRLGVVLETDQVLKAEAAQTILNRWEERHGGPDNAGRTALLSNGLKVHELGMANNDAQFLELRQFQVAEIARIFRVPLHMIGDLSRSTNNNIEQQSLEFILYTLGPWIVRWEQAIERDLITEAEGDSSGRYYAKFNVDALARGDMDARSKFYREMVNSGIYSINEVRELEDMNPVDDGDERLVQGAMTTLDRIINPPPEPQPFTPPVVQDAPADTNESDQPQLSAKLIDSALELGQTQARADAAQHAAALAAERLHDTQGTLAERTAELMAERQRVRQHEEEVARLTAERDQATAELENAERGYDGSVLAAQALVADTWNRLGRIELDGIERAARKHNFIEELDKFYPAHEKRLADALAIPSRLIELLTRKPGDIEADVKRHCDEHKAKLFDIAGECLPADLADAVDAVLETWRDIEVPTLPSLQVDKPSKPRIKVVKKTLVKDDDGNTVGVIEEHEE